MQNYFNSNHLLPNRLVFDRETAAPSNASDADVWGHDEEYTVLGKLDKRAEEHARRNADSGREADLDADRRAALDRSALDAQRERDQQKAVVDATRNAETVKKRLVNNELFDSPEERERMVREMREALSENPDKWYKYVEDHQVYSGDYAQWNLDLMIDVLGKSGASKKEARKYGGALQIVLAEDFATKGVSFEQREGKRINKFTYVNDGFIGPYTVSMLSAYLTSDLYARRNPEKAINLAELGDKFGKTRGRDAEFRKALRSLETQLAGNFSTREAFPVLASRPELHKQAMDIRESLAGGNASEEALFAYEQAYGSRPITQRIGKIIREVDAITKNKKGRIEQTPENWQMVHDLLIGTPSSYYSSEYEAAYNARGQATLESQTQVAEVLQEQEVAGEADVIRLEATDIVARDETVKEKLTIDDVPENVRSSVVGMVEEYRKYHFYPKKPYEALDLDSIATDLAPPPDGDGPKKERWTAYPRDSWPQEAYRKYRIAYEDWENYEVVYERDTEGNSTLSEEEIARDKAKLDELKDARDRAYRNMQVAVNEFEKSEHQIRLDISDKYEQALYRLASKYDFPEGNLNGDDPVENTDLSEIGIMIGYHAKYRKRHWGKYPGSNYIHDRQISGYLTEVPVRTISSPDDLLDYYKGETQEERDENRKELGVRMKNYDFVDAMNHYIYVQNYNRFLEDIKQYGTSAGDFLQMRDDLIKEEPLEDMIARVEGRESDIENEASIITQYNTYRGEYNEKMMGLTSHNNWEPFLKGALKSNDLEYNEAKDYYTKRAPFYEELSVVESDRPGLAKKNLKKIEELLPIYNETLARIEEYNNIVASNTEQDEVALDHEKFRRGMLDMIEEHDFDFQGMLQGEYKSRNKYANKIYDSCIEMGVPPSRRVIKMVEQMLLNDIADEGRNVEYGEFRREGYAVAVAPVRQKLVEEYTGTAYAYADGVLKRESKEPIALA